MDGVSGTGVVKVQYSSGSADQLELEVSTDSELLVPNLASGSYALAEYSPNDTVTW